MGPSDTEIIQTSGGPVPNETHSLRCQQAHFPGRSKLLSLTFIPRIIILINLLHIPEIPGLRLIRFSYSGRGSSIPLNISHQNIVN